MNLTAGFFQYLIPTSDRRAGHRDRDPRVRRRARPFRRPRHRRAADRPALRGRGQRDLTTRSAAGRQVLPITPERVLECAEEVSPAVDASAASPSSGLPVGWPTTM